MITNSNTKQMRQRLVFSCLNRISFQIWIKLVNLRLTLITKVNFDCFLT